MSVVSPLGAGALVDLSPEDTDLLCDVMMSYNTFEHWFNNSRGEDPELLIQNLLDRPSSRFCYQADYQSVRTRLMAKYDCGERTLVTSLVMSYAKTKPREVASVGR